MYQVLEVGDFVEITSNSHFKGLRGTIASIDSCLVHRVSINATTNHSEFYVLVMSNELKFINNYTKGVIKNG